MTEPNKISHTLCAIILLLCLTQQAVRCQISDGDEQYEAVHQDIGRISGLQSQGSHQVAPKSALVPRQQPQYSDQVSTVPVVTPVVTPRARQAGGATRRPSRITLVARRDPLPSTLTTVSQPALIAAQLPAPPQQAPSTPLEQPAFSPSFSALAPAQPDYEQAAPAPASSITLGPALSSFRSSASQVVASPAATGHSSSVSARHSALMAQVAAERAAAASLIGNEPASSALVPLGVASGADALTSQQNQHQHQHQHQHQQQPNHHHQAHQAQPSQAVSAFVGQTAPTAPVSVPQQQPHFQQATHLPAATSAQGQAVFLSQPDEPIVAPSFEHVLGHGCPQKGVFSWENKDHCDRYYICTNGTFTEEACPNGLAYSQQGAVYQHCAYNWNVDCGRKKTAEPIASPGCPWQFGLFPIVQNGRCSIDYFACEWGVPETKRCSPEGLFYDDRIKGCQWADQLGCKSEGLLNFKCPAEDEENPYWPYPRYYHDSKDVIVCVNEQPRLVHCNEDQLVDPGSLACIDINKKKKKF